MKLSMHEHQVLKAIAACHPVKSSYSKLVKETGMARNEIEEITGDLKKIGYLNVTPAKEVYLMEDGRKHLGISSDKSESSKFITLPPKAAVKLPVKDEQQVKTAIEGNKVLKPHVNDVLDLSIEQHPVLAAIDLLEAKLNKPAVVIADYDIKIQTLERLSLFLEDSIAEKLIAIKDDLERAAA
jgi:hypothetical protein